MWHTQLTQRHIPVPAIMYYLNVILYYEFVFSTVENYAVCHLLSVFLVRGNNSQGKKDSNQLLSSVAYHRQFFLHFCKKKLAHNAPS